MNDKVKIKIKQQEIQKVKTKKGDKEVLIDVKVKEDKDVNFKELKKRYSFG